MANKKEIFEFNDTTPTLKPKIIAGMLFYKCYYRGARLAALIFFQIYLSAIAESCGRAIRIHNDGHPFLILENNVHEKNNVLCVCKISVRLNITFYKHRVLLNLFSNITYTISGIFF